MDVSTRAVTAFRAVPLERSRLLPVDWLRGLVMVLMTVDHSSSAFNAGRLFGDSAQGWVPGTALPAAQFFTRWITHLCAPTFLFLSGYSLYMSVQRKKRDGASESDITRFIALRGLLIAALDPLWMVLVHRFLFVLQVLYAIGLSMVAMSVLRRLPARVCGALGLLLIVLQEAVATRLAHVEGVGRALLVFTLVPGRVGPFPVWYPVVPWLAVMLLGWAAADIARREPETFPGKLILASGLALLVFVVVRGLKGYGNAGLFREGSSLIQWLHTSKYPASLAYLACELGIAGLILTALWMAELPGWLRLPLTVLGQSAFFFYLLHAHLLRLAAWTLGLLHRTGLGMTYLAAAVVIAVLLPACERFRRYKVSHPQSLARYI
ncbi:MAG TPA: heparan-alpha-glucosaminide N-acetyltransferase domain-containing protein [Myxococcaceae bacterium]|nr:heparan-alpha-glucosaminide N-acetyltransferase domain-containing protein [Myxococcaceae bacterium]